MASSPRPVDGALTPLTLHLAFTVLTALTPHQVLTLVTPLTLATHDRERCEYPLQGGALQ